MGKEQEFLTQLKWYAYWQLNQGYALQVKPPKYELLILVELHKIERFSSQYEQELKCLSRCIRRYIWKEENEDNLWCYLKIINIVFEESARSAYERGYRATGSELVGLVPLQAMLDAGKYFLNKQRLLMQLFTTKLRLNLKHINVSSFLKKLTLLHWKKLFLMKLVQL